MWLWVSTDTQSSMVSLIIHYELETYISLFNIMSKIRFQGPVLIFPISLICPHKTYLEWDNLIISYNKQLLLYIYRSEIWHFDDRKKKSGYYLLTCEIIYDLSDFIFSQENQSHNFVFAVSEIKVFSQSYALSLPSHFSTTDCMSL